jgi:hypothetical protein
MIFFSVFLLFLRDGITIRAESVSEKGIDIHRLILDEI